MVKLKKISAMPLAKIFCVLHAFVGLILGLIVTLGSLSGQADDGFWALGPWALLLFPIVNSALGFLTGLSLAWGYNWLSKWLGAIEFEIEEPLQA